MRNKTRWELFLFSTSDIKAIEEHFEEMACKGWILDKINWFSAKYRSREPQELKFSLDIFPHFSTLDSSSPEDISEYRDLCTDAGWKLVASSNKFQVFSSKKSDKLLPIQSDKSIEEAIINKSVYLEMISWISVLTIYILSLWNLFSFDYKDLYYNISIIYMIFPIVIIPLLIHICSQALWLRKTKKAIAKGESLPRTSYKFLRFKTVLLLSTTIFLISSMGLAIVLDLFIGNYIVLIGLIPASFAIVSILIYNKINRNNGNISKGSKINTLIIGTIGVVIGISVVIFATMSFANTNKIVNLREGYSGFKLTDFNLGTPSHSSFSRNGSILIPKSSDYYEITRGNDIRTEYAKAINEKMAQYIFESIFKENYNRLRGETSSARKEYEDFDEAVYLTERKDSILLLKDKEIFLVEGSLDLSIEENKVIITNRLLNE